MRVMRCPNCDEPLPGFANYCASCGETLEPSPTSTTTKLSRRPRAFKVPRFFALRSDAEETVPFGSLPSSPSASETVKLAQKLPRYSRDSAIPLSHRASDLFEDAEIDDGRLSGNWHIIVDSRPRTPSIPRTPVLEPRKPLPLPPEYVLVTMPTRQPPSLFFWASILALCVILAGSILGIVLTLGRGALAQKSFHANEITLQVTPANVALGNVVALRGSNFSPLGQIGLTRDSNIPVVDTESNTIIRADRKGSFTDTVIVEADWQAGAHLLRAEDAITHKTAAFTIIVTGHSTSLRPPRLLLSSSAIDLGSGDQATNSTKTITLANGGGGQIAWQSAATPSWLLLSPKSGVLSGGQRIQVTVAADRSNLQPGAYTASIIFTSEAGQVILTVKMRTTLLQPGHEAILQLTPAVFSFTGVDGGSSPPAQVLTVSNPGVLPLQWSAYTSSNWLSITSQSGDVSKGGSQSVQLWVNSSALLPGTYSDFVTFTNSGSTPARGLPQSVYVSLTIVPQCALLISPGTLSFSGVYLQPGPGAKTIDVNVTQGCSAPLRWAARVTTKTGGHWLTTSPSSGVVSDNSPAKTNIGSLLSGLSANTYTGQVTITATDSVTHQSVGTPQTIVVTLIVQPSCTLQAPSLAQENFSAEVGANLNPASQSFSIGITGACTGTITITPTVTQSWLAVTPPSAVISAGSTTFTVKVTAASLAVGSHNDTVSLSAVGSNGITITGSLQTVDVALTVIAPPSLTVNPSPNGLIINVTSGTTSQPISINNTGGEPLKWTAALGADAPSFASLSASAGTNLLGGSSASDSIIVNATGVPGGTSYTTSVTVNAIDPITGNTVAGSPATIPITINIAPPVMQLDTNTLSYTASVGVNPQSQSVNLTNSGGDGLTWTAGSPSQSWLTLGMTQGSDNYQQSSTIPFNIGISGLGSGSYTATVVITPSVGAAKTVTVTLTIT